MFYSQETWHASKSMPNIIRVTAVFLLVLCLFAMVFMEFFGLTKYGLNGNEIANFRNFGNTLLLLIRMTTGEGWVCPSCFSFLPYSPFLLIELRVDRLYCGLS